MILIAYDGTPHSDYAISIAGMLLCGGQAHVLHVWEPAADPREIALGEAAGADTPAASEEQRAREVAEAGAALARLEGFDARAEALRCDGDPARAIEAAAHRLTPHLVVLGSRRLRGLQTVLKGSVSRRVGIHLPAPVLIVPPAQLEPR